MPRRAWVRYGEHGPVCSLTMLARVNQTLTRPGKLDRSERLTAQPGATLLMRHSATRSRAADGSTARLWALGIVRLTSRRRSLERFITRPRPRPLGQRI